MLLKEVGDATLAQYFEGQTLSLRYRDRGRLTRSEASDEACSAQRFALFQMRLPAAHSIIELALIELADRRISPPYYPPKCSESRAESVPLVRRVQNLDLGLCT